MSWWELRARADGFRRANASSDERTRAPTAEEHDANVLRFAHV